MGSYEVSPEHAVESSIRMIKDGRVEVNPSQFPSTPSYIQGSHHLLPFPSRP